MFELKQLRCFVVTAEELHFGRAARRLHMTQPPLSRHIQLLEHILGVALFERNSRSVRLTPAGRAFLLDARRIVRLADGAALFARQVAGGEAGSLTLGFTAASGYSYLPRLVTLCRSRLPNIHVRLREAVSGDQIEALRTGALDIGLLRPPIDRTEFAAVRLLAEPLVAALPSGDPRLARPVLDLADFGDRPFIMYAAEGARYFHDMLTRMFDTGGIKPDHVQHLSQIHSMLALVRAGLGAAIVPEAATALHFDDVAYRPVATDPPRPVELYATWRRDNDNPVLAPLVSVLEQAQDSDGSMP